MGLTCSVFSTSFIGWIVLGPTMTTPDGYNNTTVVFDATMAIIFSTVVSISIWYIFDLLFGE
jgi:hypothetical protein